MEDNPLIRYKILDIRLKIEEGKVSESQYRIFQLFQFLTYVLTIKYSHCLKKNTMIECTHIR